MRGIIIEYTIYGHCGTIYRHHVISSSDDRLYKILCCNYTECSRKTFIIAFIRGKPNSRFENAGFYQTLLRLAYLIIIFV